MSEKQVISEYLESLIQAKTVCRMKGFNSVDAFKHHVKNKAGTPQPVIIDGKQFWNRSEIEQWKPNNQRGPITTEGE